MLTAATGGEDYGSYLTEERTRSHGSSVVGLAFGPAPWVLLFIALGPQTLWGWGMGVKFASVFQSLSACGLLTSLL